MLEQLQTYDKTYKKKEKSNRMHSTTKQNNGASSVASLANPISSILPQGSGSAKLVSGAFIRNSLSTQRRATLEQGSIANSSMRLEHYRMEVFEVW